MPRVSRSAHVAFPLHLSQIMWKLKFFGRVSRRLLSPSLDQSRHMLSLSLPPSPSADLACHRCGFSSHSNHSQLASSVPLSPSLSPVSMLFLSALESLSRSTDLLPATAVCRSLPLFVLSLTALGSLSLPLCALPDCSWISLSLGGPTVNHCCPSLSFPFCLPSLCSPSLLSLSADPPFATAVHCSLSLSISRLYIFPLYLPSLYFPSLLLDLDMTCVLLLIQAFKLHSTLHNLPNLLSFDVGLQEITHEGLKRRSNKMMGNCRKIWRIEGENCKEFELGEIIQKKGRMWV